MTDEPKAKPVRMPGKKRRPAKKITDKHGRMMAVAPMLDIPFKRFFANVDMDALIHFLGDDPEKYGTFLARIHDPAFAQVSLTTIARNSGLSLHELNTLYGDGMRQTMMLNMMGHAPQVGDDVGKDAESKMEVCPRCDGLKVLTTNVLDEDGKILETNTRDCPVCEAAGKVRVKGDDHSRDIMFEGMKVIKQRGPLIALQQNFGGDAGLDADMEATLKLTQTIGIGGGESK